MKQNHTSLFTNFDTKLITEIGTYLLTGNNSIRINWLTLRFLLQFDNYKGQLNASDGGLGGGYKTVAIINKSLISFGIFPINFRILKRIDLNLGIFISGLIYESFDGTESGWNAGQPIWSHNLQDRFNSYSSLTYFGIQGRISYDFKLTNSIWISPQYLYYFGLSDEFTEFPYDTKSMRHYFCIGFKKKIRE